MKHIYSINRRRTGKMFECYHRKHEFEIQSKIIIQLLKKGLRYDTEISKLQDEIKYLKSKLNEMELQCLVCGKSMCITESNKDQIHNNIKGRYRNLCHSSCIGIGMLNQAIYKVPTRRSIDTILNLTTILINKLTYLLITIFYYLYSHKYILLILQSVDLFITLSYLIFKYKYENHYL